MNMQTFDVDIWEVKLEFQFSTELDLFNPVTLNCTTATESRMHLLKSIECNEKIVKLQINSFYRTTVKIYVLNNIFRFTRIISKDVHH